MTELQVPEGIERHFRQCPLTDPWELRAAHADKRFGGPRNAGSLCLEGDALPSKRREDTREGIGDHISSKPIGAPKMIR